MLNVQPKKQGNFIELTTNFFYALPPRTSVSEFEEELSVFKENFDGRKIKFEVEEYESREEYMADFNKRVAIIEDLIDEVLRNQAPDFCHFTLDAHYYDNEGNKLSLYDTRGSVDCLTAEVVEGVNFLYRYDFENGHELVTKLNLAITPNFFSDNYYDE
ncbi:hypothetical protein ACNO7K_07205 [Bisgaard Taxon 45]